MARVKMSDFKFTRTEDCLYVDLIHPIYKTVYKHYVFDPDALETGYAKGWIRECAPKSVPYCVYIGH